MNSGLLIAKPDTAVIANYDAFHVGEEIPTVVATSTVIGRAYGTIRCLVCSEIKAFISAPTLLSNSSSLVAEEQFLF